MAVLAACGLAIGGAVSAQASQLVEITIPARNGEINERWYSYSGPPRARVLLPDGYDPQRAYPLLLLLSGLNSNYKAWSHPSGGDIARTAAGLNAIIVMPEGASGWYADWWSGGRRDGPRWESYVLDQVLPQVLARYKIRPERRYHAIAGVSMGGLGAAYLGGRLPGFFGSVAVVSGFVDLAVYPSLLVGAAQSAFAQFNSGAPLDLQGVEGPPGGFYERGHDPVKLASNLRETRVYMASGDGTLGPEALRPDMLGYWIAETLVIAPQSVNYAAALRAAGVDVRYDRATGYHDSETPRRELRNAIRWGLFEPVDERPTSWVNDTVATHGRLWEFDYRFDAPPDRVVRFRRAGGRLTVSAAGSPVRITAAGCRFRIETPGSVPVPNVPCTAAASPAAPASRARPRVTRIRLTAGRLALRVSSPATVRVAIERRGDRGGWRTARRLSLTSDRRWATLRRSLRRLPAGRYRVVVRARSRASGRTRTVRVVRALR
ncbi:alpha/beta hydrolase-fold protein [Patulibacter defluvii]|uniref:alpha/beta hydrolase-fold protein n=1 Tax=Patulibacter defluvii TaxID=3095358 RepID=UPI002A75D5F9|nr:alpha/beta hydrolase-fold protein [Patulibacter sp. DM4]